MKNHWIKKHWSDLGCETDLEKSKASLEMIHDLAVGYDGYKGNAKKLEGLVDELRELALYTWQNISKNTKLK